MKHYEAPEHVKHWSGLDPSDPPQGQHWCSECSRWDDECICEPDTVADNATNETRDDFWKRHHQHRYRGNNGYCVECGEHITDTEAKL